MKVFELIYKVEVNKDKINIFNPDIIKKFKNIFKIIYKNKIYPLESKFKIKDMKNKEIKIKLISFINTTISIIGDITKGCQLLNDYYENINNKKYFEFLKLSLNEISKSVYKIKNNKNIKENKIQIFSEHFVDNNKDKCVIRYKDKIYPLKNYFSIQEKDESQNLEIFLIKLNYRINNKNNHVLNNNLIEKIPFFKENKNEENKYYKKRNCIRYRKFKSIY